MEHLQSWHRVHVQVVDVEQYTLNLDSVPFDGIKFILNQSPPPTNPALLGSKAHVCTFDEQALHICMSDVIALTLTCQCISGNHNVFAVTKCKTGCSLCKSGIEIKYVCLYDTAMIITMHVVPAY